MNFRLVANGFFDAGKQNFRERGENGEVGSVNSPYFAAAERSSFSRNLELSDNSNLPGRKVPLYSSGTPGYQDQSHKYVRTGNGAFCRSLYATPHAPWQDSGG
jgi:hypothetical protein